MMITTDRKYDLFIDTLNLILLPKKERIEAYDSIIKNQLEELEGDYYTFLHFDNIRELVESQYIKSEEANVVEEIRLKISKIDSSLWNPNDFIWSDEWNEIRKRVLSLVEAI